jgi:hypothetical protein
MARMVTFYVRRRLAGVPRNLHLPALDNLESLFRR